MKLISPERKYLEYKKSRPQLVLYLTQRANPLSTLRFQTSTSLSREEATTSHCAPSPWGTPSREFARARCRVWGARPTTCCRRTSVECRGPVPQSPPATACTWTSEGGARGRRGLDPCWRRPGCGSSGAECPADSDPGNRSTGSPRPWPLWTLAATDEACYRSTFPGGRIPHARTQHHADRYKIRGTPHKFLPAQTAKPHQE